MAIAVQQIRHCDGSVVENEMVNRLENLKGRIIREAFGNEAGLRSEDFPGWSFDWAEEVLILEDSQGLRTRIPLINHEDTPRIQEEFQALKALEEEHLGRRFQPSLFHRYNRGGWKGNGATRAAKPLERPTDIKKLSESLADTTKSIARGLSYPEGDPQLGRSVDNKKMVLYRHTAADFLLRQMQGRIHVRLQAATEERNTARQTGDARIPAARVILSRLDKKVENLEALKKELDEVDTYALNLALKHLPHGEDVSPQQIADAKELLLRETYGTGLKRGGLKNQRAKEAYRTDISLMLHMDPQGYRDACKAAGYKYPKALSMTDVIMRAATDFANKKFRFRGVDFNGAYLAEAPVFDDLADATKELIREDFTEVGRLANYAIPRIENEVVTLDDGGTPKQRRRVMEGRIEQYRDAIRWDIEANDIGYLESVGRLLPTGPAVGNFLDRVRSVANGAAFAQMTLAAFQALSPEYQAIIVEAVRGVLPDAIEPCLGNAATWLAALPGYTFVGIAGMLAAGTALALRGYTAQEFRAYVEGRVPREEEENESWVQWLMNAPRNLFPPAPVNPQPAPANPEPARHRYNPNGCAMM